MGDDPELLVPSRTEPVIIVTIPSEYPERFLATITIREANAADGAFFRSCASPLQRIPLLPGAGPVIDESIVR